METAKESISKIASEQESSWLNDAKARQTNIEWTKRSFKIAVRILREIRTQKATNGMTQKKLAEMLTEITKAQLLAWRVGVLKNEGKATPSQISMAKRNNVKMALDVARESRQILGAMGITDDFPIMRHIMNLESVITYEGTHDIHLLITGHDITGFSAF